MVVHNRFTAHPQDSLLLLRRDPTAQYHKGLCFVRLAGCERIRQLRSQGARSTGISPISFALKHLEPRFVAPNKARRTIRRRRFGALARDPALLRMEVGLLLPVG